MGAGTGLTLLVLALTLAAQPWSVLASILLASSRHGPVKVAAYVCGWVCALTVVAAITIAIAPAEPNSAPAAGWAVVQLSAGVVLAVWLLVRWRRVDVASGGETKQPSWLARIDTMNVVAAFVLGGFLPNYVIVIGAVGEVQSSGLSQSQATVAMIGFVLVASLGVAAPLFVLLRGHETSQRVFANWRTWLVSHNRAVLYSVGALVAVVLIARGVTALLSG